MKKHYQIQKKLNDKIKEINLKLDKKKKNSILHKNIKNDSFSKNSPEKLLDIKYIEDEIKKEEEKSLNNYYTNNNNLSNISQNKKPEYKGKLSLTKTWIIDEVIEGMKNKIFISKKNLLQIIYDVINIYMYEPTLIDIEIKPNEKFNICGDIHGQFYDLLKIFNENGFPSENNPYLFNGDFVDRGSFSVECLITLLCFKLLYPKHFYLARGNHESRNLNKVYGFEQEVISKYDSSR